MSTTFILYNQYIGRDVTIQLFWIHDSIQSQTKCLDSIQIQFFKMLIASKLDSRFNSTVNISSQFSSQFNSALQTSFQINSQFNSSERWTWCFLTNITSRPLSPFLLGMLYLYKQLEIEPQPQCCQVWLVPTDRMQMCSKRRKYIVKIEL